MITLLTDFGDADAYVAAMKGVVASMAPGVPVVDASHAVPAGDIAHAAWVLRNYWPYYPPGTVHTVVVDPGVGSARQGVLLQAHGHFFIGPDNGVFSWILKEVPEAETFFLGPDLHRPGPVSSTFHGRDIFAWTAALLLRQPDRVFVDLLPAALLVQLPGLECVRLDAGIQGEVMHIDTFGNAITNIPQNALPKEGGVIRCAHPSLTLTTIHATYSDVARGDPLALIGSHGFLELACNGDHFAQKFGRTRGDKIHIEPTIRY